jgi:hypothetical protein
LLLLLVVLGLCVARLARAEPTFDGKWRQGALREDYTVQQWLPGCGPPPVSGTSGGGEIVTIRQEGDELAFLGGGRVFRTNQCYDQMPTLSRDAHSREPSGRTWRTRCTTPPADPRRAMLNTLVVATSDTRIDIVETGRYEISLAEGRCIADVKRSRTYDLQGKDEPAAPTASTPTPPTATATERPRPVCTAPGEPARLEVRPSRKLLKTGDAFAFRAVVTDAAGCATPTPTTWSVADASKKVSVDQAGHVTVAGDAPEGNVEIVVTAAGKSARVTLEVTSPAKYEDLLRASGLNPSGENDAAAVAVIATESIGGGEARADAGAAKRRRAIFLAIVGVLAVALVVVWIVVARRAKRAKQIERDADERYAERVREAEARKDEKARTHASQVRAHQESLDRARAQALAAEAMFCSVCKSEYPRGEIFCPRDANRLVPLAKRPASPSGGGVVCPACRRGFDAGTRRCPHDGEELVPLAMRPPEPVGPPSKGKICPTCGGRFEGAAAFCGKDGTALVLLN